MKTLRGTCPVCFRRKRVTLQGYVYDHENKRRDFLCEGSWRRPTEALGAFQSLEARQRGERIELTKELCS
jgi:hypothetical protein